MMSLLKMSVKRPRDHSQLILRSHAARIAPETRVRTSHSYMGVESKNLAEDLRFGEKQVEPTCKGSREEWHHTTLRQSDRFQSYLTDFQFLGGPAILYKVLWVEFYPSTLQIHTLTS
jgi:hypothetical protein